MEPLTPENEDLATPLRLILEIRSLRAQNANLREAMKRQAAAVRMFESARQQIDGYERKTLQSLAGQDRAAVLEQVAQAREEASQWNARATQMEEERDRLAVAARNYLDAQHDKFDAETDPRATREENQRYQQRYEETWTILDALAPSRKEP